MNVQFISTTYYCLLVFYLQVIHGCIRYVLGRPDVSGHLGCLIVYVIMNGQAYELIVIALQL